MEKQSFINPVRNCTNQIYYWGWDAEEIGGKETDWRNWWGWLYGGWINQRRII